MTCLAFETVLKELENDASNLQLRKLITTGTYTGSALPSVAEEYLRAFCKTTLSHVRRRWIGLALAGMLDASPEVVEHMTAVGQQLQGIGDVILSTTELEETKIVAGIIVREALEQHIEFASFWASEKVQNSAPNFPTESGPTWIGKFQSFLDTLGELALANPTTDPSIVYPVSVMASDAFRWVSPDEGVPVAIVQHDLLTVVLPDRRPKDTQFLDIPIAHIRDTKTQPSAPLHDSQSRETSYKPWDLILELERASWAYLLNSSKRTASELTILFRRSEDAKECEMSIHELQKTTNNAIKHPENSSAISQQRAREPVQSGSNHHTQRIVYRSSPIEISRRKPARSYVEAEQSSSDQLGDTPDNQVKTSQRSPTPVKVDSQMPGRGQRVSRRTQHKLTRRSSDSKEVQVQEQDCVELGNTKPTQERTQVKTRQAQKQLDISHNKPQSKLNETREVRAQTRSMQTSSASLNSTHSPTESLGLETGTSKQTECKGKLPKVSQTAKQRSSQQMRKDLDIFEIPNEDNRNSTRRVQNITEDGSHAGPNSRTESKKTTAFSQRQQSVNHGRQTRSRRRPEDDDDFVPAATSTKRVATKRKSVTRATITSKQPVKRVKTGHKASSKSALAAVKATSGKIEDQHASDGSAERKDKKTPQSKDSEKHCISTALSRTSLIGGLLGSQKPATVTKSAFKKPALPTRAHHPPSTPTQRRLLPLMSTVRPQTPKDRRKPPNTYDAIMSSPPVMDMTDEEYIGTQHDAVETQILSSNSKPVPASPHAESTAISGHADCDDVDLEKRQGEVQTAKLDPFQQRRGGQKTTPFIRRLTGDDSAGNESALLKASPHADMFRTEAIISPDTEDLPVKATRQLSPREVFASQSPKFKRKAVEGSGDSHSTPRKRPNLSNIQHVSAHTDHSSALAQGPTPVREKKVAICAETLVLAASQQAIDNSMISEHAVEAQNEPDMDFEATLVNDDDSNEQLPRSRSIPPNFPSSSPGASSSHSSTSAEAESSPQPSLPTSEAEELEWEASLQPHQRSLHDMLMRVSNRVLRHVVDSETAVTDVAEMYENDGEHVLEDILQRQDRKYDELWDDMGVKKALLKKEMEKSTKALAKERQRISASI
jgi:hypothetical protein